MAAVQPFLSGAISKTVNLPEDATVEEIEDVYMQGWKLGLKALAVYRDNCKVGQPLSDGGSTAKDAAADKLPRARPRSRRSSSTGRSGGGCPSVAPRRPRRSPSAGPRATSPPAPTATASWARSSSSSASRARPWPA